MSSPTQKESVITFKADASLFEALRNIPNRSEFIRTAILSALENQCPLCRGSGVLTPNQKKHWDTFAQHHPMRECGDCHEVHVVCSQDDGPQAHADVESGPSGSSPAGEAP